MGRGCLAGALVMAGCAAGEPIAQPPPMSAHTHASRFDGANPKPGVAPPPKVRGLSETASCSEARAAYVEGWRVTGGTGAPDLSAGQYGAVLGMGGYIQRCGVPQSVKVAICAAVLHGQALGVTVDTSPRKPRLERCIAQRVRELSFPSHPRMDVTRTVFD